MSRLLLRTLLIACVALSASMWTLELTTRTLRAQALSFGEHTIWLFNGLRISLDRYTLLQEVIGDDHPTPIPRVRLVLAFSDDCPACRRQAATWPELVRGLTSDDEMVFLSFKGNQLIRETTQRLQERSIRWQLRTVTDSTGFGAVTGITATPAIIVLDKSSAVRFVTEDSAPNTLASLRHLLDGLHSEHSSSTRGESLESSKERKEVNGQ